MQIILNNSTYDSKMLMNKHTHILNYTIFGEYVKFEFISVYIWVNYYWMARSISCGNFQFRGSHTLYIMYRSQSVSKKLS